MEGFTNFNTLTMYLYFDFGTFLNRNENFDRIKH